MASWISSLASGRPAHAVEADRVHEVLGAQHADELAAVDLGHQHLAVLAKDVAEVGRQRIQVAQVDRRHRLAVRLRALHGRGDRRRTCRPSRPRAGRRWPGR